VSEGRDRDNVRCNNHVSVLGLTLNNRSGATVNVAPIIERFGKFGATWDVVLGELPSERRLAEVPTC
jgi:hypothetical protein